MKIVTSSQMRSIDERMTREGGESALSLMEKAGGGVAQFVSSLFQKNSWPRKGVLFAGKGQNGGDAFVAARILEENEVKTQTLVLAPLDEIKGAAKETLKKLKSRGAALTEIKSHEDLLKAVSDLGDTSIAVDGILGTGSKGPLEGLFLEAVEWINSSSFSSVIAMDIPTGLDPDKGVREGPCVRADHTITLGLPKYGLLTQEALEYIGSLHVVDLGISPEILKELKTQDFLLTPQDLHFPPRRKRVSHKGDYGHVLILGGSPGFTGAACLSALSALRVGAGLVTVGVPQSLNPIFEMKLTEPMTLPLPEGKPGFLGLKALDSILNFLKKATALVIGPGLSLDEETASLIHHLLPQVEIPVVVDADGLNALSKEMSILKKIKAPVIVTPHPGEMSRLLGCSTNEIQSSRWESAKCLAKECNTICVLKGAGTVIASVDGALWMNVTGHWAMATGGMGDILAGMIGGFLAQRMDPLEAAKLGVYLHGASGDEAVQEMNIERGLLASDLLKIIPKKLKEIGSEERTKIASPLPMRIA